MRGAGIKKRRVLTVQLQTHRYYDVGSPADGAAAEQEDRHVVGSRSLRRYTKLVDADTDKKILRELGLINGDEMEAEVKRLQPIKCGICGEFNEPFR